MNSPITQRHVDAIKNVSLSKTIIEYTSPFDHSYKSVVVLVRLDGCVDFQVDCDSYSDGNVYRTKDFGEALAHFLNIAPQEDQNCHEMINTFAEAGSVQTVLSLDPDNETDCNSSVSNEDLYDVSDFSVKQSLVDIGHEYAYMVTVRNNSAAQSDYTGKLLFLDSEGFHVTEEYISSFSVPPNSEYIHKGVTTIYEDSHLDRISGINIEIEPL